jgi:hypothetical protein
MSAIRCPAVVAQPEPVSRPQLRPPLLTPDDLPPQLRAVAEIDHVPCPIDGVTRLSGWGCLHYQATAEFRRWHVGVGGRLIPHRRYVACLSCEFLLSDEDRELLIKRKQATIGRLAAQWRAFRPAAKGGW